MDVPSHLLQPLSVDTNITYDLDMTLFPGLDDPQHMYKPALFIATDWTQYVADDDHYDVKTDKEILSVDVDNDLFSLIESCEDLVSNFKPDGWTDQDITDLLRDVTSESVFEENVQPLNTWMLKETSTEDLFTDISSSASKGRKRRRSESNNYPASKKPRTSEPFVNIPSLVFVQRSYDSCCFHRES